MADYSAYADDVTELTKCVVDQKIYVDECREFVERTVRRRRMRLTVDVGPRSEMDAGVGPDREGLAEWPGTLPEGNNSSLDRTGLTEQIADTLLVPVRTRRVAARYRPYAVRMI